MLITNVPHRRIFALFSLLAAVAPLLTGCPTPNNSEVAPAAPGGLTATLLSSSSVSLSWQDLSTNETGFKVERMIASVSTYQVAATLPANTTSFADSGLSASTAYSYKVRAYNCAGDSADSNVVTVTTAATNFAPSGLAATATGPGQSTSHGSTIPAMKRDSASSPARPPRPRGSALLPTWPRIRLFTTRARESRLWSSAGTG